MSAKSGHTQGPWSVTHQVATDFRFDIIGGGITLATCGNSRDTDSVNAHNARLIAASPLLLVALVELREQIKSLNGYELTRDLDTYKAQANWDYAMEQADRVIAKAAK